MVHGYVFANPNVEILEKEILSNIEVIRAKSCVLNSLEADDYGRAKEIYQMIINYDYYEMDDFLKFEHKDQGLKDMIKRVHKAYKPHVTVFEKKEIELVRQKMLNLRKSDFSCSQL